MADKDETKAFRFRINDDVLVPIWAEHNNAYRGMELTPEQCFKAFEEFLIKVFKKVLEEEQYDLSGCTDPEIRKLKKTRNKYVHDTPDAKKAIFEYMSERTLRRCEKLMPKLEAYSDKVDLPVGHQEKNYYTSKKQTIQNLAGLFK